MNPSPPERYSDSRMNIGRALVAHLCKRQANREPLSYPGLEGGSTMCFPLQGVGCCASRMQCLL